MDKTILYLHKIDKKITTDEPCCAADWLCIVSRSGTPWKKRLYSKIHCASTVLEAVLAIDGGAAEGGRGGEESWDGAGGGGWPCAAEKDSEFLCSRQRKEPACVVGEQTQVFAPPIESVEGDLFIEGHEVTSFWAVEGGECNACSCPDG